MKQRIRIQVVFIGKSMLWSLLLYAAVMLVINWDDISNTVAGKNAIAVVNNIPEQQVPVVNNPPSISHHTGTLKTILLAVKAVSGLTTISIVK